MSHPNIIVNLVSSLVPAAVTAVDLVALTQAVIRRMLQSAPSKAPARLTISGWGEINAAPGGMSKLIMDSGGLL
jgi:1,6-anhydro-N-acetylmuramate kinase